MVLFAILRAPHDAPYSQFQCDFQCHFLPLEQVSFVSTQTPQYDKLIISTRDKIFNISIDCYTPIS